MLLRRLSAHLQAQNWMAIWIDFLIVVVGVFVASQVTIWNAARDDQSRESIYLSALAKDIRSDIAEIDDIIHVSTVRMSALDRLLRTSTGRELPDGFDSARGRIEIESFRPYADNDPATLGIALFILSTLDGNRAAYETIINTGGIGVIRNAALAREIQDYYAMVDKVLHFEVGLEGNRDRLIDAEQVAGVSPVDETTADELAVLFAESAPMTAAAKNYWLYTNRHLTLMSDLRRAAERLAENLEAPGPASGAD